MLSIFNSLLVDIQSRRETQSHSCILMTLMVVLWRKYLHLAGMVIPNLHAVCMAKTSMKLSNKQRLKQKAASE